VLRSVMVDLARKLRRFKDLIDNTLDHGVTSALAENTNTHIAALVRRAYGFHSPEALIAMIELTRSGLFPDLAGRTA
jgi:transposase